MGFLGHMIGGGANMKETEWTWWISKVAKKLLTEFYRLYWETIFLLQTSHGDVY